MPWENEFRERIIEFSKSFPAKNDSAPISIKVRITNGCYHREHSPNAYEIIDEFMHSNPHDDFDFVEHESGPELLTYLALAAAGANLSASVVNLITTILKARAEGIKRGDRPDAPLELIIRGFDKNGKLTEEKVLRLDSSHDINKSLIQKALLSTADKLLPKKTSTKKSRTKK